jgi:hypothetical protein
MLITSHRNCWIDVWDCIYSNDETSPCQDCGGNLFMHNSNGQAYLLLLCTTVATYPLTLAASLLQQFIQNKEISLHLASIPDHKIHSEPTWVGPHACMSHPPSALATASWSIVACMSALSSEHHKPAHTQRLSNPPPPRAAAHTQVSPTVGERGGNKPAKTH